MVRQHLPPRAGLGTNPSPRYRNLTMKQTGPEGGGCCPPANQRPDTRPVEGPRAEAELAQLAKALGHPARVRILGILSRRASCMCGEMVTELGLAQSTVSQHLKVLKAVGLIRGEVSGPRTCYCIEPRTLRRFKALVGGM